MLVHKLPAKDEVSCLSLSIMKYKYNHILCFIVNLLGQTFVVTVTVGIINELITVSISVK